MFGRRARAETAPRIFVSYRRADTAALAERLRDHLLGGIEGSVVFLDSHAIPPADDFPEKITREIGQTDVFVALIGAKWTGADVTGARRLVDERDFVRIEVATALEQNVPVLPVVVDDTIMPSVADLPLDIAMVSRLNAVPMHTATFTADSDKLVRAVRDLITGGKRPPAEAVPQDLLGTWVSAGGGDAVLQYDIYPNHTYQHVGIIRQQVPDGVFTFEVFHEGALKVSKTAITFEAYRATATRSHPEHPFEDYRDQPRRPETATLTWRFQNTGTQKVLILGDGSTGAVAYHHVGRSSSPTRARQTPVPAQAPALSADTASGALVDWFRLFDAARPVHINPRTAWKVMTLPGEAVVHVFEPDGAVFDIDVLPIPRDGTFKPFFAGDRRLPVEVGWYAGATHRGTRRDGTDGRYEVKPGYMARWVIAP